jgi:hypothetical protein
MLSESERERRLERKDRKHRKKHEEIRLVS